MPENILEKIIKKKIEKVDILKKSIDLKSLDELINSKCFFHLEGLTKKIGSFRAAQTPLIAPNVRPKLNILVTPCPGMALT